MLVEGGIVTFRSIITGPTIKAHDESCPYKTIWLAHAIRACFMRQILLF